MKTNVAWKTKGWRFLRFEKLTLAGGGASNSFYIIKVWRFKFAVGFA